MMRPEKKQEQETSKSLLEELIREGARRLLQVAIEQEVTEYLERFREEKDDNGHRMVVRNGKTANVLDKMPKSVQPKATVGYYSHSSEINNIITIEI